MEIKKIVLIALKILFMALPIFAFTAFILFEKDTAGYNISFSITLVGILSHCFICDLILIKSISNSIKKEKINLNKVLKLAYEKKGLITENELSFFMNITLEESKELLEKLVIKGSAEMQVDDSGKISYYFKEFTE